MTTTILGLGSLLSIDSARQTAPGLRNFRVVEVPGYRRIFNKTGFEFIDRFGAEPGDIAIAACATRAIAGSTLVCSAFEVGADDRANLEEREFHYRWVEVDYRGSAATGRGWMCTEDTDDAFLARCGSRAEYERRLGRYRGQLWRTDILPFPMYLDFCIAAARGLGPTVLDNFLDASVLADGRTTIRQYVRTTTHP